METTAKRNKGIELLRIVLTIMICAIHSLDNGGILINSSELAKKVFSFVYISCFCCVDGYGLISGYISTNHTIKYGKIVYLWVETIFYSFVVSLVLFLFGVVDGTYFTKNIFHMILPVLNSQFWYITAYLPIMLISPFINRGLDNFDKSDLKKLFFITVLFFSVFCLVEDNYLSNGYSFLWLLILYVLGNIMRRINYLQNVSSIKLFLLFLLMSLITFIFKIILKKEMLTSFISPTVLFSAMCLVVIFSRINMKKDVRVLSSSTLGIYLLQCNKIVWEYVFHNLFSFIGDYTLVVSVLLFIGCSLILFIAGFIVDKIREIIFDLFKINKLCNILSFKIEGLMQKISA